MTLNIGALIHSRYRIEYVIAQGGMGAIYAAIDQSLGVKVALKENRFSSDQASRQFHREATILAGIRHPNLPRVTDHFVIPEQGQYLVMDFIEGKDLRERLDIEKTISEEEALWIGCSICDALSYLHTRVPPIVHRDIKPGNIKITPEGHAFLVDFGLAKQSLTGQATTLGAQALTPGYAPPEQYTQGTEPRSDIYALGATLYAAMTGQLPEDSLARAMGVQNLTPIQKLNHRISEAAASAIEKAMEIPLDNRHPDAQAFKQAMLRANPGIFNCHEPHKTNPVQEPTLNHLDSKISDPQQAKPVLPQKRKLPTMAIIGAGLLLTMCMAGILYFAFIKENLIGVAKQISLPTVTTDAAITTPTIQPLSIATKEAVAQTDLIITETSTPTTVPTQIPPTLSPTAIRTQTGGGSGQIAYASTESGTVQIWTLSLDDQSTQLISNMPDGACQPSWSPDGSKLVIVSPCDGIKDLYQGSGLFIINADGTGLTPLSMVPGGDFDPDWSPDGTKIVFTSIREGIPHIFVYDLTTKRETRLSPPTTNDQYPRWSPDGKWIAFESTRLGIKQIWMMDSQGGSAKEISSIDGGTAVMPAWSPNGDIVVYSSGNNLPWLTAKAISSITAPEVKISEIRPALEAEYSKDGFWLIFQSVKDGKSDLYMMMANGNNLTRLTQGESNHFQPTWRPAIQ